MITSSLLVYSYGFTSFKKDLGKIGGPVFESIEWNSSNGQIKGHIWNCGNWNVTINQIYVNGTLDKKGVIIPQVLLPDQTAEFTLSETHTIIPKQIKIEITNENNKKFSSYEHSFMTD